ncbi:MAG: slipin family protein [Deltaproteobacteria bacterium]|nr:slipin family protein [Deltaproteobacteria bacterium]
MFGLGISWGVVIFIVLAFLISGVRILNEYERGVIFRLGRVIASKGPGIIYVIPIIDKMVRMSLRTITMDVPPQDVITKDNVSIKVNAVVYFRVMDTQKAVVEVEDYLYATSQLAQTTLRSVLGQNELDQLLTEREALNIRLQEILDRQTDPWGVKVSHVEVKHIDLPKEMQRAMARQAEAERERRAKVIHADGEYEASSRLAQAARNISQDPVALQLRFLQTIGEMASEHNTTTILPFPIDIIKPFMQAMERSGGQQGKTS